ncbi:MAG: hypothetical protein ACOCV8_04605 [Spirochaetota bacterium]
MKKYAHNFLCLCFIISLITLMLLYCSPSNNESDALSSFVEDTVSFTCDETESEIKAKNPASLSFDNSTIYIGYYQKTGDNQDPVAAKFTDGNKDWCKIDYEVTGTDGRGIGLLWNGEDILYGAFTVDGTQGDESQDFRSFAANGWLKSASDSSNGWGGGKVSIILKIDPDTGDGKLATFISAKKSDGKTNSVLATDMSWDGENLTVYADSWYSPRKTDKSPMSCSGNSPFKYTIKFDADLSNAISAEAENCN